MEKLNAKMLVAIGKNDCRDHDFVADNAADRVPCAIHLRGDCFDDYAVTAIRRLHQANPSAVEARITTLLSALVLALTGKEMPRLAGGIALAVDPERLGTDDCFRPHDLPKTKDSMRSKFPGGKR
jgi:hypothetical protein